MKITVKKSELLKTMIEVFNETENSHAEGIEIEIYDNKLKIAIIECGGFGCCDDFDIIKGLTEKEILSLP